MRTGRLRLAASPFTFLALAAVEAAVSDPPVRVPAADLGVDAFPAWKAAQVKAAKDFGVFHDFRFEDRLAESGITFVQRPTEDSGKFYKAVHHDHGNGLAAADVDGDAHG